jgi:hypothetical protein
MSRELRARFRVEVGMLAATVALLIVTLIWQDWIEIVFGVDPDARSGSLEQFIVAACGATALLLLILSSREWGRSPRVERSMG